MKQYEAYILLKPDSCFYFEKIEKLIIQYNYKILSYQIVKNYFKFCKKLRNIEKDNLITFNLSLIGAKFETKLFLNHAIIIKVSRAAANLKDFLNFNFKFKKLIRKKIGCFSCNRASLITNLNNTKLKFNSNFGEIKVLKNGKLSSVTGLRLTTGNWCAVAINLIHISGPSENEHFETIKIIKNSKFKVLTMYEIAFIKKHKTYYF